MSKNLQNNNNNNNVTKMIRKHLKKVASKFKTGFGKEKHTREDAKDNEINRLRDRVKDLEEKLNETHLHTLAQDREEDKDYEETFDSLRTGSLRSTTTYSSTLNNSSNSENDSSSYLEDYYQGRGIFARPDNQQKLRFSKLKKKNLKSAIASHVRVSNEDRLVEQYSMISTLGEVMHACDNLSWRGSMYTPLSTLFATATIPRVTLSKLEKILDKHQEPAVLRIMTEVDIDNVKRLWNKHERGLQDLKYKLIWSNKSNLDRFGHPNLQSYDECFEKMMTNVKSQRLMLESINFAVFERGDLQPKREIYQYYGSVPGVREEATPCVVQFTPVLVQVKNKVHFGLFIETNAAQKYPKEVKNLVTRAHAVFKYTESALTLFTPCGVILQQNPTSNKIFGLEACENNVYSDFQRNGRPVDRIRAMFGQNESLYDEMWETVMEQDRIWLKRMKLSKHHLMPRPELNMSSQSSHISMSGSHNSLTRSGSQDNISGTESHDNSSGSYTSSSKELNRSGSSGLRSGSEYDFFTSVNEEHMADSAVWYQVSFLKFSDPADGETALFCEMQDIHRVVLQEEKLQAARKHEHEILQSIIPQHIIEHLLEEKESESTSVSRTNSDVSDNYLDITALQMSNDNRVRAMAEHHSQVTVCFVDIVDFTKISSCCSPGDVMIMLNRLFTLFDDISDNHNIYKVETIGDAYMCVAGLKGTALGFGSQSASPKYHAERMVAYAKDILHNAKSIITSKGAPVEVRIGLHSGDVVTGIVGYKMPRFCLFGDTVNVASRMESTGKAGCIHASQATRDLVPGEGWTATGGVEVKGKGMIATYLYDCPKSWG